jgi:hypothetical protein
MHRRRRHRHRVGADRSGRTYFLGYGEGVLEQLVQQRAQRARLFGAARGILNLAEDLGLADDHQIEATGDAEHVTNHITLQIGVQIR